MGSSTIIKLKMVVVGLSIVTVILGCVSHFDSTWVKTTCLSTNFCLKPYELCDMPEANKCPKIAMERYFVAMVTLCCVLSTVFLLIDLLGKGKKETMKTIDAGYHAVAAGLLVIAAILYIVSTEQINDIFHVNKRAAGDINFRRPEKHAAAGLTAAQGLLCAATAILIYKE